MSEWKIDRGGTRWWQMTATARLRQDVRERIASRELRPDEPIGITDLSRIHGFGHESASAALWDLCEEGFVRAATQPQKSAFAVASSDEVAQVLSELEAGGYVEAVTSDRSWFQFVRNPEAQARSIAMSARAAERLILEEMLANRIKRGDRIFVLDWALRLDLYAPSVRKALLRLRTSGLVALVGQPATGQWFARGPMG